MVLIVGICSTIGIHIAGDFLADVFELEDTGVAQKYIRDVAFGTGNDVLHLGGGRIPERGAKSPMILIGGPGRVQVEFDTAALFEKPDGTPHVVGPRPSGPVRTRHAESEFHLEGFERLREPLINLRDQYIGSASGEPMVVTGRSLDGLPISVADVRGVFSVRRADGGVETEASIDQPYPFRPRDIENLIYRQSVPVMTGGAEPSGLPGQWAQVMQDLIEAALREFMSQNRFAEYFAGVGARELELSEFLQDTILSRSLQISKDTAEPVAPDPQTESGFRPRTDLSRSFRKYSSEFSLKAQEHGLELHWIGVGTWKMPDEKTSTVVDGKHLEAWRENRENAQRSEAQALERATEAARIEGKLQLIQETPIASHEKNRSRYSSKAVLLECLLQNYLEQLRSALDIVDRNPAESADRQILDNAILMLEDLLRVPDAGQLFASGPEDRIRPVDPTTTNHDGPPAPSSRAEAAQYQRLLGKLEGKYRVAEAMIANEARRHAGLSREDLITRIVQRFERHGK
jgi:hypothetical protein